MSAALDTMDLELSFLLSPDGPSPAAVPVELAAPVRRTYTLVRKCPWVGLLDVGVGRAALAAGLHLPSPTLEQMEILERAGQAICSLLKEVKQ